jgi:type I restriction enzyme S subunit
MSYLIAFFIASAPLEGWLMRRTKGIAYTGINIETLKALPIPVPPIVEQHRIVAEVDRRLSLVRGVEAQVDANLTRAERLRQTILSQAFSGGLLQHGVGKPETTSSIPTAAGMHITTA